MVWLIDAARGTVTALANLDPAARAVAQAQAVERNRTMGERNTTPIRSPDGQYLAYSTSIRDNAGQLLNEETGRAGTAPCRDGWRQDSTGYYFIDLSRWGLLGHGPGPVRLLLVHPPPPPQHWWQR